MRRLESAPTRVLAGALLATLIPLGAGVLTTSGATATAGAASARASDATIEVRVIGESVRGRKIRAYHLGQPGKQKVVLISTMHGNEPATRQILDALRNGPPIRGLNLWVVPTYNPDGLARRTRKNAHGVDLNRNYPYRWADLDGNYESGPRPASEPETRAMMRFLRDVRPSRILSFHQPLYGVDTDTKLPRFARRTARKLNLPAKVFDCGGVCHGTMTMWFNHRFRGGAVTVEYSAHPRRHRMRVRAPRQVLSIWGARRG
ncbi:MAG: M14 family zinc carboxypeptidase [Nocardioides sp.]